MDSVCDFVHDKVCCDFIKKKPKQAITYAWFLSLLLVFVLLIVGIVTASREEGGSAALGFAAVWTVLLAVALSVGGTLVMRKYQTSLAIGFFLGVVSVMSQQCLIVSAIFGGESEMDNVDDEGNAEESSADQAMCVFSFFLFVVYAFFSLLLAVFRNDLIRDETFDPNDPELSNTENPADELPPTPH